MPNQEQHERGTQIYENYLRCQSKKISTNGESMLFEDMTMHENRLAYKKNIIYPLPLTNI